MSAKANFFKIGIFVISATTISIIAIVVLGVGTMFQKKVMVETYIDGSVQGLDVGSPFKLRGVTLGNVEEITFVGEEYKLDRTSEKFLEYDQYILIKAAFEPRRKVNKKEQRRIIESMIAKGLRVRLASQGITGAAYLEADYIDPEEFEEYPQLEIGWKPKNYYIPSIPSTTKELTESVDTILEKVEEINVKGITERLEKILGSVNKILDDVKVTKIVNDAEQLLVGLSETNKHLGPLLSDASATMATVRRITGESEKPLTESLTALGELPEIFAQLKRTLRQFNYFVSNEEQNVGMSTENVRIITGNLRDLTENARRYPSYLLFGNPPPHSYPGGKQ